MRELRNHPLYAAKKEDFDMLIQYLQNTLYPLQITGAIVFGSLVREEQVAAEHSDVDIVAYSASFSRANSMEYQEWIRSKGGAFLDKSPIFIEDFISPRIEYYLHIGNTTFDINIFPTELGGYEKRYYNGTHDSLELVIGAMYQEARLLFGVVPFEALLQEEFLPFYNDELREMRMNQLKTRIQAGLKKIQYGIDYAQDDLLYHVYKIREYLLKWMFINARKYPVSYSRYLRRQLTEVLGISDQATDKLLLQGSSQNQAYLSFLDTAFHIISNMKDGKLEEENVG